MNKNLLIREYDLPLPANGQKLSHLTYMVKDFIHVSGYPVGYGLKPELILKSEKSASIVTKLAALGARLLASTNMDPAAAGISGKNPFYGDMVNPLNPSLPAGGSGGGAAISVAEGMADFAIGSDHGGSIRIPAALCQVYGLKLTPGIIETDGCVLLDTDLDCPGIIAKDPSTIKLVLNSIYNFKNKTYPEKLLIPGRPDLKYCSEEVKTKFLNMADKLSNKAEISELNTNIGLEEITRLRKIIICRGYKDLFLKYNYKGLLPELEAIVKYADHINDATYEAAIRQASEISELINGTLNDKGPLLTPLFPVDIRNILSHESDINIYMSVANLCGLPSLNLLSDPPSLLTGPAHTEIMLCNTAENLIFTK